MSRCERFIEIPFAMAVPSLASYTALSSASSMVSLRSTMPFTITQLGKDADLMNVLARLGDDYDGLLPSAFATSCE